jgi:hypothetical protein
MMQTATDVIYETIASFQHGPSWSLAVTGSTMVMAAGWKKLQIAVHHRLVLGVASQSCLQSYEKGSINAHLRNNVW